MSLDAILSTIDAEIARLQEARRLLAGLAMLNFMDSIKSTTPAPATAPTKARRTMSAAARKRIGDAQRKRWAAQKKAAKKK